MVTSDPRESLYSGCDAPSLCPLLAPPVNRDPEPVISAPSSKLLFLRTAGGPWEEEEEDPQARSLHKLQLGVHETSGCSAAAEDPKPGAVQRLAFQQGAAAAHKPAAFRSSASCCAKGSSQQAQKAAVY
ncbi:hypothetical protein NN561_017807 [Cricetulus griseus]